MWLRLLFPFFKHPPPPVRYEPNHVFFGGLPEPQSLFLPVIVVGTPVGVSLIGVLAYLVGSINYQGHPGVDSLFFSTIISFNDQLFPPICLVVFWKDSIFWVQRMDMATPKTQPLGVSEHLTVCQALALGPDSEPGAEVELRRAREAMRRG